MEVLLPQDLSPDSQAAAFKLQESASHVSTMAPCLHLVCTDSLCCAYGRVLMFFLASGATQLGELVGRGSAGPDCCHAAALRWVRVTTPLSVDSHIGAALICRQALALPLLLYVLPGPAPE